MDLDLDLILDMALKEGKAISINIRPNSFQSPAWTAEEDQYIAKNIGLGYDAVAAALGRTSSAIHVRQVRRGLPAPSKRPGWLTGNQAARALGVDIHSVMRLAKWKCLPVETIPGEKGILNIRLITLYRWATRPNNWIYFKIHRMQDLHLQRLVILAQERWGDKWISIGEASTLLGQCRQGNALNDRIHRGQFPESRWNGIWYFPLSVVEGLIGKVGSGKGGSAKASYEQSRIITRADRWMMHAKYELGWTHQRIAESMGNPKWNTKSVATRLARLRKFELEGK